MLTNARQQVAVVKCIENFKKAINTLKNNMGYEFVAFDLKEASYYLEEIVGKVTTEDLLTNIFENFCIGK